MINSDRLPRPRRVGVPWMVLIRRLALAVVGALAGCGLLALVGVLVHPVFVVVVTLGATFAYWVVAEVISPAPPSPDPQPTLDVAHRVNRNADRRVRKLEEILSGSNPRRAMTNSDLRQVIAGLAEHRFGPRSTRNPLAADVPPELGAYLATDPPPALPRHRLRLIIEELSRP